ncbi:GGDEF domain-containing protein [Devosia chinhatensis]|uniref:diguanylate cyclase n=1 Tax=Devosia chinhatensis TaxID=429727 RepID=A0A0F5FNH9_9HYPH|nr:GGDEF domain-containing protein [Devosia chinhatensis]KKB10100.1 hypothetical protein VE26_10030 [Devosia chinhatensis]
MLDNASLMVGIAFSSASLMAALLIGWLNSRQESYLVHGASGIGLIVLGVGIMAFRSDQYNLLVTLVPYSLLIIAFTLIYSASRLFRTARPRRWPIWMIGGLSLVALHVSFLLGYSGIGTIVLNLSAGIIMLLCAREYWVGRREAPVALSANTFVYGLTALSFLACAAVLLWEQSWVLTAPADNWAEDFNSIMSLVGLTGIGAITLTLHHARAARRHRDEANTDALTGVLNRRALFARFPEIDTVHRVAVIMFDLDHFKQINDRMGHAHGDLVLQEFAQILKAHLRDRDVIARLGGEEFCAILPGLDQEQARHAAERVRLAFAALDMPIGVEGGVATVSAGLSIGGGTETFSSALSRADDALYKAKHAGRNQVQLATLRLVA